MRKITQNRWLGTTFKAAVPARLFRTFTAVAIALGILAGTPASAEVPASHPMRFGHLTLDQGLSQSNVLAVLQDSEGMMWFGTENGLNRYDGYEFSYYKRDRGNPNALNNDFIFDIAEDRTGHLWLATNGGGLAKLNRRNGAVVTYRHDTENDNSVSSNAIRRILIDRNGIIWIGTRGAGLDRFDPETEVFSSVALGVEPAAASGTVFAIYEDAAGTLWIGGDHGLTRIDADTGELTAYAADATAATSISPYSVRAIIEDSKNQLWVGSYGGGLSRLNRETGEFEHFVHDPNDPATISHDRVSSIYEDSDGRRWVGTAKSCLPTRDDRITSIAGSESCLPRAAN